MNKKIVFTDGKVIEAKGFGSNRKVISEIIFNTSMVGYQEIVTDNSYCGQSVVMTYPLIGNYGTNEFDIESYKRAIDELIVNEYAQ